jgi:hypothetical protein
MTNTKNNSFTSMVSVTGPADEVDFLTKAMDIDGNPSFCRLVPMPEAVSDQSFSFLLSSGEVVSSSPEQSWSEWQEENWGPVGGEYGLRVSTERHSSQSDRKLLRFSYQTDGSPYNEKFLCSVSRQLKSSVFVVVSRRGNDGALSFLTLCGGFVMTSGNLSDAAQPVSSEAASILERFKLRNASSSDDWSSLATDSFPDS